MSNALEALNELLAEIDAGFVEGIDLVRANVARQVSELPKRSAVIATAVDSGNLKLHGAI